VEQKKSRTNRRKKDKERIFHRKEKGMECKKKNAQGLNAGIRGEKRLV